VLYCICIIHQSVHSCNHYLHVFTNTSFYPKYSKSYIVYITVHSKLKMTEIHDITSVLVIVMVNSMYDGPAGYRTFQSVPPQLANVLVIQQ